MRRSLLSLLSVTVGIFVFSLSSWGQTNPYDLTGDGSVTQADVTAAINMSLGTVPCTANIIGPNVCNVVVVQRVTNAVLNGSSGHTVGLNWVASTSGSVTNYKVYRKLPTDASYTAIATLGIMTSYTDATVVSGMTYVYALTALDSNNNESTLSNSAQAIIP